MHFDQLHRREFLTLLSGVATWPLAAGAQQPAMPVIGFLSSLSARDAARIMAAFYQGLNEAGYVEGRNVALEYPFRRRICSHCTATVCCTFCLRRPLFFNHREKVVALAARHRTPTIYAYREQVEAGGLISCGASRSDAYRQAGSFVGRLLKGENPGTLPVVLPTKFELVLNLKTAKALGLTVPMIMQMTADEVIE
jgi:hypothetical protein